MPQGTVAVFQAPRPLSTRTNVTGGLSREPDWDEIESPFLGLVEAGANTDSDGSAAPGPDSAGNLDGRALDDRALNDRALNDRALNDRAPDDRALDDRALDDHALGPEWHANGAGARPAPASTWSGAVPPARTPAHAADPADRPQLPGRGAHSSGLISARISNQRGAHEATSPAYALPADDESSDLEATLDATWVPAGSDLVPLDPRVPRAAGDAAADDTDADADADGPAGVAGSGRTTGSGGSARPATKRELPAAGKPKAERAPRAERQAKTVSPS
ncbi:MAG TPA: hypothetical protein VGF84_13990, partial [Micromonosporaceae bacterium]